jgi:ribonuclease BN (tRNA processing enzyme)
VAASITVLGSSSGMPGGSRTCSGYVIEVENRLTLLDCGSGVARALLKFGFDLEALDHVVISHTHPDHVCDLPLLIQYLHLCKKTTPVDLYLPEEFQTVFGQMIRAMYVIPERYAFELRVRGYRSGTLCEYPIRIEAIPNRHLRSYGGDIQRLGLPNQMQSCSLRAEVDGVRVLYSGDISGFDDILRELDTCDVLLLETSHVDLAGVLAFAAGHPKLRVVLTHRTENDAVDELSEQIRKFPNLTIAEDGMTIDLIPA